MNIELPDANKVAIGKAPEFMTSQEALRFLVNYATLAPSLGNAQPWRVRGTENCLEMKPDLSRRLPDCDPDNRHLVISCGAAMVNAEVACRYFGNEARFETNGHGPLGEHWLARLHRQDEITPTARDARLFKGIGARHTARKAFLKRDITDLQMRKLLEIMEEGQVAATQVDDVASRGLLAEVALTNAANRERIHQRPHNKVGCRAFFQRCFMLRANGPTHQSQISLHRSMLAYPRLLVLSTQQDTVHEWIRFGGVMEKALLYAASSGIQASYLGELTRSPKAREETRHMLAITGTPQVVLGLGYTDSQPETPRRPAHSLIMD